MVSDLGYLLAMEAHGRQGIMEIRVMDPVVLWQLHGLLGPLFQIMKFCIRHSTVCIAACSFQLILPMAHDSLRCPSKHTALPAVAALQAGACLSTYQKRLLPRPDVLASAA